jgi:hypothetical protein
MPKWEYKTISVYRGLSGKRYLMDGNGDQKNFQLIDLLNHHGQLGWELVNVIDRDLTSTEGFIADIKLSQTFENLTCVETYYFKRVTNN